jgi:hypothetical protein
LKAIAVDESSEEATRPEPPPSPDATDGPGPDITGERRKTLMPRAGSKLAGIIELLQRSDGATILQLMEATGWLPHTTRAALTGLRKRGYAVVRERIDGGDSIYRIAGCATDDGYRAVIELEASADSDRELQPKASQAA